MTGFEDLIVGAAEGGDGGNYAGEAYVVFGANSGFGTTDGTGRQVPRSLRLYSSTEGFIIQGDAGQVTRPALAFSSAGDVNNDGFEDLIVGARYGDDGRRVMLERPMWLFGANSRVRHNEMGRAVRSSISPP